MKKQIFMLAVCFGFFIAAGQPSLQPNTLKPLLAPKGTMLVGALATAEHRNIPKFNVFFNGKTLGTGNDGMFRCKTECDITDELFILVGQYSVPKPKRHNTMRRVAINPKSKYRFFRLGINPNDAKKWCVEEADLKKYNYEVPQHTFVVALNPDIIAKGLPFELTVHQTDDKRLIMPKLLLKQGVTNKELQRASARSLLYPLGNDNEHGAARFHTPVLTYEKKEQGRHLVEISRYVDNN